MSRGTPRAVGSLAALALTAGLVVGLPGPAQAAPDGDDCTGVNQSDIVEKKPPTQRSAPLQALQIAEAQRIVERRTGTDEAGQGVIVAVVDSGVRTDAVAVVDQTRAGAMQSFQGTALAGIVAGEPDDDGVGLIGIAPGARVYDARFYDTTNPDDGDTPTVDNLVTGLEAIVPLVGRGSGDIRIVNISFATEDDDDALKAVIDEITEAGAIVVASSGDRQPLAGQQDDEEDDDSAYEPGEDVTLYPAGYARTNPLVVSVGTTVEPGVENAAEPTGLLSSSIDVVVPTYGAVSYTVNGSTCSFYQSSTVVAAAEVSGVLALLAAAFPDDTPQQLIARLEVTATGDAASDGGSVDKYRGRGIVQPVEALTRPVRPDESGTVAAGGRGAPDAAPAALPPSEPDVLRGTRRNAVWWGLFGGGALVVAMLLRPVLSRRRGRA